MVDSRCFIMACRSFNPNMAFNKGVTSSIHLALSIMLNKIADAMISSDCFFVFLIINIVLNTMTIRFCSVVTLYLLSLTTSQAPIQSNLLGNPIIVESEPRTPSTPTHAATNNSPCCQCIDSHPEQGCPLDKACEEFVCGAVGLDKCCTRKWDAQCVNAAMTKCETINPCCGCQTPHYGAGCYYDKECEHTICRADPFCCSHEWDDTCTKQAHAVCTNEDIPPCCGCTILNEYGGCLVDGHCEESICAVDPFCCEKRWDEQCVGKAKRVCDGEPFPQAPENEAEFIQNAFALMDAPSNHNNHMH
eukprot:299009_1